MILTWPYTYLYPQTTKGGKGGSKNLLWFPQKSNEKAGNQQRAIDSQTISKAIDPQRSACKVTQNKAGREAQHAPWDPPAGHVR